MIIDKLAAVFFAVALLHSFLVTIFAKISRRFPAGSAAEAFFHLLSEVEVVFGFWAILFYLFWIVLEGVKPVIQHHQSLNMTEPLFIFCIMILASTRPLVHLARAIILKTSQVVARFTKFDKKLVQVFILLFLGPLSGSLITEPAAITLLALLIYRMIPEDIEESLLYGLLAILFVNVSIGGGLTHFAAPPILIVASQWGWGLKDVFVNLGEAVIAAALLNTIFFVFLFRKKIKLQLHAITEESYPMPNWVVISHIAFLILLVMSAHYSQVFFGIFLVFIGFSTVTKSYQDGLKFKEGLLVAFFLAGLIVFGSFQRWWLEPIISSMSDKALYFSATSLTAITDNAALTYLGSQVSQLSESAKWALVSGAITGGGLTILANAPNPAGFSILSTKFPNKSLNAYKLFIAALPLTLITIVCFLILGRF